VSGGGRRRGDGISPARNGSKWIVPSRRAAIYARDGHRCLYCGSSEVLTLDHVNGHSNRSENLATCCLSCNSAKRNISQRAWYKLLRIRLGITVEQTARIRNRLYRQLKRPVVISNKSIAA
jgi:hypothetical protein